MMKAIWTTILVLVLTVLVHAEDNTISVTLQEDLSPQGRLTVEIEFPLHQITLENREEIAKFRRQAELLVWRLEQAERKFAARTAAPVSVSVHPLHVRDSAHIAKQEQPRMVCKNGVCWLAGGPDKILAMEAKSYEQQVALGDACWRLAEQAEGEKKAELSAKARHWYTQATPKLQGLQRLKIEKRMALKK